MFLLNKPQYYFINHSFYFIGDYGIALGIEEKFAKGAKRAIYTERFREQIIAWNEEVEQVATDELSKILQYAKILCDELNNDIDEDEAITYSSYNSTTAGAIFEKETSSYGYAKAFNLLASGEGIPVMTVLSEADYAWNVIKFDGKWYILDAYHADEETSILSWYLLTSTSKVNVGKVHIVSPEMKKYTPKCNSDYNDKLEDTLSGPVFENSGCKVKLKTTTKFPIYYTLDGTTPTPSNGTRYDGEFTVEDGTIVKAAVFEFYGIEEDYEYEDAEYKDKPYSSSRIACDIVHNLEAPMLNSLKVTKDGIKISWGSVIGADKYVVYRKEDDGEYTRIKITSSKSYVDKDVTKGHLYAYTVAATDKSEKIGGYNNSGLKTLYINSGSITSIKAGSKSFKVTWNKIPHADGYQIAYSTSKSFGKSKTIAVEATESLSKTITGLAKGKVYYVRIRGYKVINDKQYYGTWGNTKSVTVK